MSLLYVYYIYIYVLYCVWIFCELCAALYQNRTVNFLLRTLQLHPPSPKKKVIKNIWPFTFSIPRKKNQEKKEENNCQGARS